MGSCRDGTAGRRHRIVTIIQTNDRTSRPRRAGAWFLSGRPRRRAQKRLEGREPRSQLQQRESEAQCTSSSVRINW